MSQKCHKTLAQRTGVAYDGRLFPESAMSPARLTLSQAALGAALLLCQCGAKPAANSYDVAVTFTPGATARLQALGDKAEVSGYYYGAPTDAVKSLVNEAGEIELGEDQSDIDPSSQTVHIAGKAIDPVAVTKVAAPGARVRVTVYTVRKTTDLDPLACTSFDDLVATAHAKPVAISCDVTK